MTDRDVMQQVLDAWDERPAGMKDLCVAMDALRAALEQHHERKPVQWQPINTPPNDGENVLVYLPGATHLKVLVAHLQDPFEDRTKEHCQWLTPSSPTGRRYVFIPNPATHWMPLPPVPTAHHIQEPKS